MKGKRVSPLCAVGCCKSLCGRQRPRIHHWLDSLKMGACCAMPIVWLLPVPTCITRVHSLTLCAFQLRDAAVMRYPIPGGADPLIQVYAPLYWGTRGTVSVDLSQVDYKWRRNIDQIITFLAHLTAICQWLLVTPKCQLTHVWESRTRRRRHRCCAPKQPQRTSSRAAQQSPTNRAVLLLNAHTENHRFIQGVFVSQ